MNLAPCPSCGDATFDLHLTAYGICARCEVRFMPIRELAALEVAS